MPGGFIGVDVFFVISGYLISTIILADLQQNTFSFQHFYTRRIKRILPSLLTVLSSCLVFGWFALLSDEYQLLGKHATGGALFFSNFLLWSESGYFDTAAELKPLLHLWSLGIEEQFYLIWPLILWLTSKVKLNPFVTILTLLTCSLFFNLYEVNANPVADFYSPLTRFWELLFGAMLAFGLLNKKGGFPTANYGQWLCLLGACLLAFGCKVINKHSEFPGWLALLPVLGATCLIVAGENSWINRYLLSNRVMVWIGLISFPLYLWHWPLLAFAKLIEGGEPRSHIRFWLIVLSIALSWLTYTLIERPIRFGNQASKTVYALLAWLIFTALMGWHISTYKGYPFRSQLHNTTITEAARDQLVGAEWKYKQNQTCLKRNPFDAAKEYGWWFCIQNKDQPPGILILGSSFANHLYPGFINNSDLANKGVLNIGACAVGLEDDDANTLGTHPCAYKRPSSQRNFIHQLIEQQNSIEFVILSGFSDHITQTYLKNIRDEILALKNYKVQLIVFTLHAQPGFDPKLCYSAPFRKEVKDCTFSPEKLHFLQKRFEPIKQTILDVDPTALFFDPNKMYCKENQCSYISNGMPLNRDHGHFSEYGSIELQKDFHLWANTHVPKLFKSSNSQSHTQQ